MLIKKILKLGFVPTLFSFAMIFTGCEGDLIENIKIMPSQELDHLQVVVNFRPEVELKYDGRLEVKDYGYGFISAKKGNKPFQMGIHLKTSVVYDPEFYSKFERKNQLSNGVSINVSHALTEIRGPSENGFELATYVDTTHLEWLGLAALFKFKEHPQFSSEKIRVQVFMWDHVEPKGERSNEQPIVIVKFFGPKVSQRGELVRAAGASFFINFRKVIESGRVKPGETLVLKPLL